MEAGGAGSPEFDEPLSIAGPPRSYPSESLLPYVQTVKTDKEGHINIKKLNIFGKKKGQEDDDGDDEEQELSERWLSKPGNPLYSGLQGLGLSSIFFFILVLVYMKMPSTTPVMPPDEVNTTMLEMSVSYWTLLGLNVTLVPYGHSPKLTSRHLGQSIVFYQEFAVLGGSNHSSNFSISATSSVCPEDFNITWTRYPNELSRSKGRYCTGCNITTGSTLIVNVTLEVVNLDFVDEGLYDVNLAIDGCSNDSLFKLEIPDCNLTNPPRSNPLHFNPVVAEPSAGEIYRYNVTLNGDNDDDNYLIRWLRSGEDLCPDTKKYNCTRENILNCTIVAGLHVAGLTSKDSGEIQVQPFPLISGGTTGNNTIVELEVLPHPYFMDGESTYHYSPEINDHSVSISVGNYSKYVTACIRSATGCERYLDLKPQPPHGTWAKAALDRVDPLDGRDYSVCLSYSPNVDLRFTDFRDRCQEISLSASKAIGTVTGTAVGGFFVLIIALAAGGVCVGLAVRKRRRSRENVAGRRDRRGRRSTELEDAQSLLGGDAVTVYGAGGTSGREVIDTDHSGSRTKRGLVVGRPSPHPPAIPRPPAIPQPSVPGLQSTSPSPPPLPNPQSYEHNVYGWIPKVAILYTHNPFEYTEVQRIMREDGTILNEQEILEHEDKRRITIKENQQAVSRFARFLQKYGIPVAYDQLLWDTSADNSLRWLHQQIVESKYIILIITPSLNPFLTAREMPSTEREVIFTGPFLYNLLHSSENENQFLPVFLNRSKDTDLLPLTLKHAVHMYEVHDENFEQDLKSPVGEERDLQRLYRLLTNQKVQGPTEFLGVYQVEGNRERQPLSSDDINRIAEDSSFSQHYEIVAKQLELSDRDIEDCKAKGLGDPNEVCYQVLMRWRENVGYDKATVGRLLLAVRDVLDRDVYCRLEESYTAS